MPVLSANSDGTPVVAYALLDSGGRMRAERSPDVAFYAASTVKLGVMLAVVLAAERGDLSLDDTLICRRRFAYAGGGGAGAGGVLGGDVFGGGAAGGVTGAVRRAEVVHGAGDARKDVGGRGTEIGIAPGVCDDETFEVAPDDRDPLFPPDGTAARIGDLVGMMIRRSSNEATNLLFDLVGPAAIAEAFRRCGASSTRMERRIGDLRAIRAGLTNETTPGDLARIMRSIVSGRLATAQGTEWMCDVLSGQEHARIGDVIADGTRWGSKSGDVPGVEHDVAFIGDPASVPWFLAVCTRGFEPEQGREVIRAVAQAVLGATPHRRA